MIPGVFTPSELFAAERAGFPWVKLFPAEISHYQALRAVCLQTTRFIAVGGVSLANIDDWVASGVDGIGIGSALFNPTDDATVFRQKSEQWAAALGLS